MRYFVIIKKRLFSVLMAIVMTFSILPTFVFAETGDTFTVNTDNGIPVFYKVLTEDANGGTVAVVRQGSKPAIPTDTFELTLPETVENNGKTYTVTEIGESAFEGCTNLEYIKLPSSLTKIRNKAFYGCSDLWDVEIDSEYPPEIGDNVFEGCAIELLIFIPDNTMSDYIEAGWPEEFLSYNTFIDGYVFDTYDNDIKGAIVSLYDEKGKLLESYTTKDNGYYCFTTVEPNCTYTIKIEKDGYITRTINCAVELGFNEVYIPLANSNKGFSVNTSEGEPITYEILTKDDNSKTGTVRIVYGSDPLYNGLLTLPNAVMYDGIDYTVTEIGVSAFDSYKSIKLNSLPQNIKYIGKYAFLSCENIELTSLPNNLEMIDQRAFAYCNSLESIIIPSSLKKIGEAAFRCCLNLSRVISNNKIPAELENDVFIENDLTKVYIPSGMTQAYIDANWPEDLLEEAFFGVSGKVVDESGNGIADAKVTIYNDSGYKESVYTDSDGNYSFENYAENGLYTIKVEKTGYTVSFRNIEIKGSNINNFNIVMTSVSSNVPEDGNLLPSTHTDDSNEANITQTSINNTPQMGDNAQYVIYIAFGCMLIAIMVAGILVIKKKS